MPMHEPARVHGSSLLRAFKKLVLGGIVVQTALATACGGDSDTSSLSGCRVADDGPRYACGVYSVKLTGDLTACRLAKDGAGTQSDCSATCGATVQACTRSGDSVQCDTGCREGRRYTALDEHTAPIAFDAGSHLARMAFFEAASVDSFALLERELTAHGAPARLLRGCARARRDEIRHARMTESLARRQGSDVVAPPVLAPPPPRSLEAIATENAVEGCVRETFGVLTALWQAEHAPTRELRALFASLAADEARHAALAARIDAWVMTRLSASAQRRVESARAAAFAQIDASLDGVPVRGVGLPSPAEARRLFEAWRALPVAA